MKVRFNSAFAVVAFSALALTAGCSKKLTRAKAAKVITKSAAFQAQKVMRFPVGIVVSGTDIARAYPVLEREYLLLNNANVAALEGLGSGQYRFSWKPLGPSRTKQVGPNEYDFAYGKRELISVDGIAEAGEGQAEVEFSWEWKPILIEHPASSWEQGYNEAITSWLKDAHEVGT